MSPKESYYRAMNVIVEAATLYGVASCRSLIAHPKFAEEYGSDFPVNLEKALNNGIFNEGKLNQMISLNAESVASWNRNLATESLSK